MDNLPFELIFLITDCLTTNELITFRQFFRYEYKLQFIRLHKTKFITNNCVIYHQNDHDDYPNINTRYLKTFLNADINGIENIPRNVNRITIPNIRFDKIPYGIKEIEIFHIRTPLPIKFPSSLRILKFGDAFNLPLVNLPPKLKYLKLGTNFNQSIDNLPVHLETLIIRDRKHECNFNQKLDKLPINLKTLVITSLHELDIYNLPNSITHLLISNIAIKSSVLTLPSKLIHWDIPYDFNIKSEVNLPASLIKITSSGTIFRNTQYLKLVGLYNVVNISGSSSIKHVDLRNISRLNGILQVTLPEGIETVIMNNTGLVTNFPQSIKKLKLTNFNNKVFESPLPNLEYLSYANPYSAHIEDLPFTLKVLKLDSIHISFDEIFKTCVNLEKIHCNAEVTFLPPKIRVAILLSAYQKLDFPIPKTLVKMTLKNRIDVPRSVKYVTYV